MGASSKSRPRFFKILDIQKQWGMPSKVPLKARRLLSHNPRTRLRRRLTTSKLV